MRLRDTYGDVSTHFGFQQDYPDQHHGANEQIGFIAARWHGARADQIGSQFDKHYATFKLDFIKSLRLDYS